jgi:hypothetical protein
VTTETLGGQDRADPRLEKGLAVIRQFVPVGRLKNEGSAGQRECQKQPKAVPHSERGLDR